MQLARAQALLIRGCGAHCATAAWAGETPNPSSGRSRLIGSTESIVVAAIASRDLRILTSQQLQGQSMQTAAFTSQAPKIPSNALSATLSGTP
jgi:hypothetical protein